MKISDLAQLDVSIAVEYHEASYVFEGRVEETCADRIVHVKLNLSQDDVPHEIIDEGMEQTAGIAVGLYVIQGTEEHTMPCEVLSIDEPLNRAKRIIVRLRVI